MEDKIKSGKQLIVIGGGAAGFFCAVNAARMNRNLQVTIVEKTNKLLSKVRVSGGGRCNVTHACFEIDDMMKRYPRGGKFVRKAFHQFFTNNTVEWFKERGVELKTEADGRMFPVSNSSQTIVDCLLREANQYRVEILMNRDVKQVEQHPDRFVLSLGNGEKMEADYVCIACGGFPKASHFEWLAALGHSIEAPVPSLFTFNMPGNPIVELMGVAVEKALVKITGTKLTEEGPLLITHWGISGPVVLKLSAWGARELATREWKFDIQINWLPAYHEQQFRERLQELRFENASQKISVKNPFHMPARLWEFLLQQTGIKPDIRWADLPSKDQNKLVRSVCAFEAHVSGKTTFKEEFVTAGGVKLSEIEPDTMMSKKLPHLFFAGEILDVDGITGGYNFQHAWTSGYIAAKTIAGKG